MRGKYIEYAFIEGAPHDNRCLSWYDSYQEEAYIRNGWGEKFSEEEVKRMKFSTICLKVLKDSWKYKWYSDWGYKDLCVDEEDERYIWKVKDINKNKENDTRRKK